MFRNTFLREAAEKSSTLDRFALQKDAENRAKECERKITTISQRETYLLLKLLVDEYKEGSSTKNLEDEIDEAYSDKPLKVQIWGKNVFKYFKELVEKDRFDTLNNLVNEVEKTREIGNKEGISDKKILALKLPVFFNKINCNVSCLMEQESQGR